MALVDLISSEKPDSLIQQPQVETGQQRAASAKAAEVEQETVDRPLLEVAKAAKESEFLSDNFIRYVQRMPTDEDPNFELSQDQWAQIRGNYTKQEQGYLGKATSQADFEAKQRYVKEDRDREEFIDSSGYGMPLRVAASIVDPTQAVLGSLTAGLTYSAKAGRIGNALRSATTNGLVAAGTEGMISLSNTQRTSQDIYGAMLSGFVFGGVLGARKGSHTDIRDIDVQSNVLDKAKNEVVIQQATDVARKNNVRYDVETSPISRKWAINEDAVQSKLASHEIRLGMEAQQIPLSRKAKELTKKELTKVRKQISDAEEKMKLKTREFHAKVGAPASRFDADIIAKFEDDLAMAHAPAFDNAHAKVAELEERLAHSDRAGKAKKDLANWSTMSYDEKVASLYDGDIPTKAHVEKQKVKVRKQLDKVVNEATQSHRQSIGAAKAESYDVHIVSKDLSNTLDNLMDDFYQHGAERNVNVGLGNETLGEKLVSSHTTVDMSKSDALRALNYAMTENPQKATKGLTMSIMADTFHRRIKYKGGNGYNNGFHGYIDSEYGATGWTKSGAIKREFDDKVYQHIVGAEKSTNPHVIEAANGVAAEFKAALELRVKSGERGFAGETHEIPNPEYTKAKKAYDEMDSMTTTEARKAAQEHLATLDPTITKVVEPVKPTADYIPFTLNPKKMAKQIVEQNRGRVREVLSQGYQRGASKIPKKYADIIAELQMHRTTSRLLGQKYSNLESMVTTESLDILKKDLVDSGVKPSTVDEYVANLKEARAKEFISDRARHRLGVDYTTKVGDLSIMDLLETNVGQIVDNYGREAAGSSAIAAKGFRTPTELKMTIDAAMKHGINESPEHASRITKDAKILMDDVEQILGKNIEEASDNVKNTSRRARGFVSSVLMGRMGLSAFPEMSRVLAYHGVGSVLSNIKGLGYMSSKSARKGGKAGAKHVREELEELEEVIGFSGEDHWLSNHGTNDEDFSGYSTGAWGKVDSVLEAGQRAMYHTSMQSFLQGGNEKLATRSIRNDIAKMAEGGKFSSVIVEQMGYSKQEFKQVLDWMKNNPKYTTDGKTRMLNFEAMPDEMRERLGSSINRLGGREVQRLFVGEQSIFMNKTWGKNLLQFQKFSITSFEKQFVNGLRSEGLVMYSTMAYSAIMSYGLYALGAELKMLTMSKSDKRKAQKEFYSTQGKIFGTLSKMNQTAGLTWAGDKLSTVIPLPDNMLQSGNKGGFRPMRSASDLAPMFGSAENILKMGNGLSNTLDSDKTAREQGEDQALESAIRLMPFQNTLGFKEVINAFTSK